MAGTAGRLSHISMPALQGWARPTGSPDGLGAGQRRRAGRAANSSAVMPVMIRRADMPGRRRPLAVWRSIIEWDDVRHGSAQLIPDPLLQVWRSSAVDGLSFAFG